VTSTKHFVTQALADKGPERVLRPPSIFLFSKKTQQVISLNPFPFISILHVFSISQLVGVTLSATCPEMLWQRRGDALKLPTLGRAFSGRISLP